MYRYLVIFIFLSSFLGACSCSTTPVRSLASNSYDYESEDKIRFTNFESYFPYEKNHHELTLENRYEVDIMYKIVALGNLRLHKGKSSCAVSGQEGEFTVLAAQESCQLTIVTDKSLNIHEGEIRVYKKNDNDQMLAISEVIYLNTFSERQCKILLKHAYLSQNPDTLHSSQYNIINNKYILKKSFINDCKAMTAAKVDDHNKNNLFRYCIGKYAPNRKNPFKNSADGGIDIKSYHDHISEVADFDVDNYCQDVE